MEDIIGKRFGQLVVIANAPPRYLYGQNYSYCLCKCDCGVEKEIRRDHLLSGNSKSCGCKVHSNGKHRMYKTRLYSIWVNMRTRCNATKHKAYKNYGGRGIKVCVDWDNGNDGFVNFSKWALAHGYNDELTIDRIDNEKGYNPDNCRWITFNEQQHNKRSNHYVIYNGEVLDVTQLSAKYNIRRAKVYYHLKKGKSVDEIIAKYGGII